MKLAIMQPYVFPYIGYYQLMRAVDRFVIVDDLTYIKQGWINRNRILINGEVKYFTIPLKKAASTTLIKDMTIDDEGQAGWRKKLLVTVENFYRRAPFFSTAFPIVQDVFQMPTSSIADMARRSLTRVAEYADITVDFIPSSTRYGNEALKGEDRVIDTCLREGADHYINAIGGQELYAPERFAVRGLALSFLQSRADGYRQFREPFAPWLSIVDVLMFNSREKLQAMLEQYDLV